MLMIFQVQVLRAEDRETRDHGLGHAYNDFCFLFPLLHLSEFLRFGRTIEMIT